jgi:lysophospholipase L1-like esterase
MSSLDRTYSLLLTLVSIVVCLAGFELVIRTLDDGMDFNIEQWKYAREVKRVADDPDLGHQHLPNISTRLMGADFRTNSKGLRDREFSYERDGSAARIMMLGDSLTLGWGARAEDTFSKRIERMFADRQMPAEVINTGVGNYNTVMETRFFQLEGYKYRPDIIVLNHFVNDAEPVPSYSKNEFLKTLNCYTCVVTMGAIDNLLRMMGQRPQWVEYYNGLYAEQSPTWARAKSSIEELAKYCRANSIKLVIAALPELHNPKAYQFQRITDRVRSVAEQEHVDFIDLLPYLQQEEPEKLWVSAPDPHPNARAHQLIADGLFTKLWPLVLASAKARAQQPK